MEDENMIAEPIEQQTEPQPVQDAPKSETNVYETIIAQQQAQIDALTNQTNTLTQQITNLINNGAQLGVSAGLQAAQDVQPAQPAQAFNPKSLAETDSFLSMEDLAKEIGKR